MTVKQKLLYMVELRSQISALDGERANRESALTGSRTEFKEGPCAQGATTDKIGSALAGIECLDDVLQMRRFELRELERWALAAFMALTMEEQTVMMLRYFKEKDPRDIADDRHISLSHYYHLHATSIATIEHSERLQRECSKNLVVDSSK